MQISRIGNPLEIESRPVFVWVGAWAARGRDMEQEVTANGHSVSFGGDEYVLKLDYAHSRTTL